MLRSPLEYPRYHTVTDNTGLVLIVYPSGASHQPFYFFVFWLARTFNFQLPHSVYIPVLSDLLSCPLLSAVYILVLSYIWSCPSLSNVYILVLFYLRSFPFYLMYYIRVSSDDLRSCVFYLMYIFEFRLMIFRLALFIYCIFSSFLRWYGLVPPVYCIYWRLFLHP